MDDLLMVGIGGAGCRIASYLQNAVGCPAVAVNTDKKSLEQGPLARQLLIGLKTCGGYGANVPARGRRAAEESGDDLVSVLSDARILILVAGLGGGTGTGAAPVLARLARERGLGVIAAVTLPFAVEEISRERALDGLRELKETGAIMLIHDHAAHDSDDGASMVALLDRSASCLKKLVVAHIAHLDIALAS